MLGGGFHIVPVYSLEVKAFFCAPIRSSSLQICPGLGRLLVPLKNKCSKKCEMPLIFFVSYFEPVPKSAHSVTASVSFIGATTHRRPFLKVLFWNFIL